MYPKGNNLKLSFHLFVSLLEEIQPRIELHHSLKFQNGGDDFFFNFASRIAIFRLQEFWPMWRKKITKEGKNSFEFNKHKLKGKLKQETQIINR